MLNIIVEDRTQESCAYLTEESRYEDTKDTKCGFVLPEFQKLRVLRVFVLKSPSHPLLDATFQTPYS